MIKYFVQYFLLMICICRSVDAQTGSVLLPACKLVVWPWLGLAVPEDVWVLISIHVHSYDGYSVHRAVCTVQSFDARESLLYRTDYGRLDRETLIKS
jgi:hypothetical protein